MRHKKRVPKECLPYYELGYEHGVKDETRRCEAERKRILRLLHLREEDLAWFTKKHRSRSAIVSRDKARLRIKMSDGRYRVIQFDSVETCQLVKELIEERRGKPKGSYIG